VLFTEACEVSRRLFSLAPLLRGERLLPQILKTKRPR
jgi:hypothetical protein